MQMTVLGLFKYYSIIKGKWYVYRVPCPSSPLINCPFSQSVPKASCKFPVVGGRDHRRASKIVLHEMFAAPGKGQLAAFCAFWDTQRAVVQGTTPVGRTLWWHCVLMKRNSQRCIISVYWLDHVHNYTVVYTDYTVVCANIWFCIYCLWVVASGLVGWAETWLKQDLEAGQEALGKGM